jgi:hypothetical protein
VLVVLPRGDAVEGRCARSDWAMVRCSRLFVARLAGSAGGGLGGVGEFAQVVTDRVEGELALRAGEAA